MAVMMVAFWGAVAFLAVWLARSLGPMSAGDDAMSALRGRLAAGEINQDEFEKTKGLLQG
jgi:uncharacterized membrane protein